MKKREPELRKDPVSGEWILLSTLRAKRPHHFAKKTKEKPSPKSICPFEDPQKSGNGAPILWFPHPSKMKKKGSVNLKDWFVQIIHNKYPGVVYHHGECPSEIEKGINATMEGVGFHDVVITRHHTKSLGRMSTEEVVVLIKAYKERLKELLNEKCLKYSLIFHNHGSDAGASFYHPHSQIIALPIIPRDIHRSLLGSKKYFKENNKCVHCDMILWEKKKKKRIIYQNKSFIVFTPYASQVPFELRIFPLRHQSRFERLNKKDEILLADALIKALRSIYKGLNDPPYNFFIHTSPLGKGHDHYHWHLEILPKTSIFAGMELATGMEILTVSPEDAAPFLRKKI